MGAPAQEGKWSRRLPVKPLRRVAAMAEVSMVASFHGRRESGDAGLRGGRADGGPLVEDTHVVGRARRPQGWDHVSH